MLSSGAVSHPGTYAIPLEGKPGMPFFQPLYMVETVFCNLPSTGSFGLCILCIADLGSAVLFLLGDMYVL